MSKSKPGGRNAVLAAKKHHADEKKRRDANKVKRKAAES